MSLDREELKSYPRNKIAARGFNILQFSVLHTPTHKRVQLDLH